MDMKERNGINYAIISYVLILFLVASFITIGIGFIICFINELPFDELYKSMVTVDFTEFEPQILKASALTQGYGNLVAYLLSFVLVVIFMRKQLIDDFKNLKENPSYYIIYSIAFGIAFVVLSLVIDIVISQFVDASTNQATIENIIYNGGAIPMIISVVFLAPIVEELIYRKAIFKLNENKNIAFSYFLSIVLFTLPHMISSDVSNILNWFLQCIPYASCGFMLCYIYDKSNRNIYTVIIAHMMNNLLACLFMFM